MLHAFLSFFVGDSAMQIQLSIFSWYGTGVGPFFFRIFSFSSWISRNVPCNGRNDHFIYDILFALLLNFILT